jgi:hypothetical protein
VQAIGRGSSSRFLHGRAVNDNEAQFAAIDHLT